MFDKVAEKIVDTYLVGAEAQHAGGRHVEVALGLYSLRTFNGIG